ncbi:MAG: amidase [Actinomycetota bacterium]|jgi:amidase
MATFIERFDTSGSGPRLAVKDLIDMEGVPTTAACKAVADAAEPAKADAPLLAGARAAGARIVGKTNLHELALGVTGVNPWFGTPTNPLDPALVPGGSSSGSAVAVGSGEADVAYGSDTGGSVRTPSACCGTAGLKTTWGRVPLEGVWLLSESLDTIGPMARDVAGLIIGMELLEPGFAVSEDVPRVVGRLTVPGVDPAIDRAVDRALAAAEIEVVPIELPGWDESRTAASTILIAEAYANDQHLLSHTSVGEDVRFLLGLGEHITAEQVAEARSAQEVWRRELAGAFERVEAIALPTLKMFPPRIDDPPNLEMADLALPVNAAGVPSLALPVLTDGPLPASIQLIGPHNSEERLLAVGRVVEAAASQSGS